MRFSARVFGVILSLILLIFFVKPTFAQNQNLIPNTNPDVPRNMHTYTQTTMIEVMSAMICQLAGVDIISPDQACLGIDRETGKIGFVKNGGGAIGVAGTLITTTYAIPIHFSDYIAYETSKFGFPQKTYAQGIGFRGLTPVLGLFTIFRNISYILFVLVFVIVGIAVMLRLRIDPRTVMTIQNQIPKLIIGLVMITFSYAIAGFLIDMMWVGTYFVINTLTPTEIVKEVTGYTTLSTPGFVNDLFGANADANNGGILGLAGAAAGSVGSLVSDLINSPNVTNAIGQPSPTDIIGGIIAGFIAGILGFIAGVVAFFIFVIAVLVQLFKLWFALLKCFINILLGVILAPFWILAGLLPGASPNVGWGGWLRHMVGNLAPFPAIVFLFLIARTIVNAVAGGTTDVTQNFNPPLLGNVSNTTWYGALIAVGFILAAPNVVEQVKRAFKAAEVGGLGGLGAGQAIVGGFVGGSMSRLFRRDQFGNPIGVGAVWLAQRQNTLARRFGRLMGWRNIPTIREQAEQRVRSKETSKQVVEEAQRIRREREQGGGGQNQPPAGGNA